MTSGGAVTTGAVVTSGEADCAPDGAADTTCPSARVLVATAALGTDGAAVVPALGASTRYEPAPTAMIATAARPSIRGVFERAPPTVGAAGTDLAADGAELGAAAGAPIGAPHVSQKVIPGRANGCPFGHTCRLLAMLPPYRTVCPTPPDPCAEATAEAVPGQPQTHLGTAPGPFGKLSLREGAPTPPRPPAWERRLAPPPRRPGRARRERAIPCGASLHG